MVYACVMTISWESIALLRNVINTALMMDTVLITSVFVNQVSKEYFVIRRNVLTIVVIMVFAKKINAFVKRDFMGKTAL